MLGNSRNLEFRELRIPGNPESEFQIPGIPRIPGIFAPKEIREFLGIPGSPQELREVWTKAGMPGETPKKLKKPRNGSENAGGRDKNRGGRDKNRGGA